MPLLFCQFRNGDVLVRFLNGASFLQPLLKTSTGCSASKKVLSWSFIAVSTVVEASILLYSLSVVNLLVKRKAISAHKLPATGSRIGLAAQTVFRAFTACSRAAGVGFSSAYGSLLLVQS